MKNTLLIILILSITACNTTTEQTKPSEVVTLTDNAELSDIYKKDQADRQTDNIDWDVVSKNDSLREIRIYEMLDANLVRTSKDYHNAAMIFQHGGDSKAYGMAVELMRKSIELDTTANKWLLAAATDRYLLSKEEPQIYGTQYHKFGKDEPWVLADIDTTQITDAERKEYGVETLAEQRAKVIQMNKKKLSTFAEGRSTAEVVKFIKSNFNNGSEYDLSENAINSFGYDILGQGKNQEALKIFKLNTELNPEGYNTWDSYGECLLSLGEKEAGIKAYKKSLELNPKNTGAQKVIEENK